MSKIVVSHYALASSPVAGPRATLELAARRFTSTGYSCLLWRSPSLLARHVSAPRTGAATVALKLVVRAGFYRHCVENQLLKHSPYGATPALPRDQASWFRTGSRNADPS